MKIPIWTQLVEFFAITLKWLYGYLGSYGLAIIALTFLARLALFPLTIKQTKSMKEIQKIQPKLNEIKQKHKDDKQKQSEELMKAIKTHNYNPLSGCLPMILQLPIFFALFRVLIGTGKEGVLGEVTKGLASSSFLGLGLSQTAWKVIKATLFKGAITLGGVWTLVPYLIMVLAMAASQWWSNKAMATNDPQQGRMMNMMLLFLVFIGFTLPAGVIIYWVTTNILTAAQHLITIKFLEGETAKA